MDLKEMRSLKSVFLQFLLMLVVLLAIAVSIPFLLLFCGVQSGYLTPANYNEPILEKAKQQIRRSDKFTADLIPKGMSYLLLDENDRVVEGNMNPIATKRGVEFAKGNYTNTSSSLRYDAIVKEDYSILIEYSIRSAYANPGWNRVLPGPDVVAFVLVGFNMIIACTVATLSFSQKLKDQILPLHRVAKEISAQNLNFDLGSSRIREFNDVLISFDQMRETLKNALEKQWVEEEKRRQQIMALAHDFKTPLTVVIGNADLLLETPLNAEQSTYVADLQQYAMYLDHSVSSLIELSQTTSGIGFQPSRVKTSDFIREVMGKLLPIATLKEIDIAYEPRPIPDAIYCDPGLLERAILNIVSNAVDFTPIGGRISFEARQIDEAMVFRVTDSGKGFSTEALAKGKDHFYMDSTSRSSRNHYGIGLAITDNIATLHRGVLRLENDTEGLKGAKVSLMIPTTE